MSVRLCSALRRTIRCHCVSLWLIHTDSVAGVNTTEPLRVVHMSSRTYLTFKSIRGLDAPLWLSWTHAMPGPQPPVAHSLGASQCNHDGAHRQIPRQLSCLIFTRLDANSEVRGKANPADSPRLAVGFEQLCRKSWGSPGKLACSAGIPLTLGRQLQDGPKCTVGLNSERWNSTTTGPR